MTIKEAKKLLSDKTVWEDMTDVEQALLTLLRDLDKRVEELEPPPFSGATYRG